MNVYRQDCSNLENLEKWPAAAAAAGGSLIDHDNH